MYVAMVVIDAYQMIHCITAYLLLECCKELPLQYCND